MSILEVSHVQHQGEENIIPQGKGIQQIEVLEHKAQVAPAGRAGCCSSGTAGYTTRSTGRAAPTARCTVSSVSPARASR